MKTNVFRRLGQGILAAALFTAFTQVSFAQTMASAKPAETLVAPAALEVMVYQIPETTKFKVHFLNHSDHKVTVRLRDDKNQVVYSEVISAKNYIRKFDLEKLTDGAYHFEISNGNQNIQREVDLRTFTARNIQIQ